MVTRWCLGDFDADTITAEEGKDFTDHERIAAHLQTGISFVQPYLTWERVTNENTNSLIRQ